MARRQSHFKMELGGDIDKWRRWVLAFDGNLQKASERATKRATLFLLAEIHNRIKGGRYKKLAPLTSLLRSFEGYGQIPLVRRGRLLRAITTDVVNAYEGHVGLLAQFASKRDRDPVTGRFKKGSEQETNIGQLLHDGGSIKITDKMRIAFARRLGRLARKNNSSILKRRGSTKGRIRIPPRPFIKDVFEDPSVIAKASQIYYDELSKTVGF